MISRRSIASRSSATRRSLSRASARACWSRTVIRPLPPAFAWYIAMSQSRMSSSAGVVLGGLHGDADAGVGADVDPAQPHRPGQRVATRGRPARRRPSSSTFSQTTTNSSPPKRATRSPGPHRRAQPVGHLDEQLVAGGVAERVVDDLEVVEVEEEAGQAAGAGAEPLGDVLRQQGAVGQPGQRVVVGLVGELGLEGQPVGDVLDRADEARADTRG